MTFHTLMFVAALAGSRAALISSDDPSGDHVHLAAQTTRPATHAVRGVVKAVTATSLVITRSGSKASDLVLVVNASTSREGTLVLGATVAVRYYIEGHTLVATAVTVREPSRRVRVRQSFPGHGDVKLPCCLEQQS